MLVGLVHRTQRAAVYKNTRSLGRCFSNPYGDFKEIRVAHLGSNHILENLALEQHLFHNEGLKIPTLLLYRNGPTIVIGKHQNPWKECHLDRIRKEGVVLARRKSGGGAVYQDLGNMCFGFLTPIFEQSTAPLDARKTNNEILIRALKRCRIDANVSGRNDLETQGRKFSGSAYELDLGGKHTIKKALHHGTLLLDVNFGDLEKFLNPSRPKLKSKGVESVTARVINLKEINPDITHDQVSSAIVEEFSREFPRTKVIVEYMGNPIDYHPKVREIVKKWSDSAWVLGQTPEFTDQLETRFPWGGIELCLNVENGKISSAKTYSDSLHPELIDDLNSELNSKHYNYSVDGFRELAETLRFKHSENSTYIQHISDMQDWISKTI